MTHWLHAEYEGADIKLAFSETCQAQLLINGISREEVNSDDQQITLKLGSPVQTGYEHHEFIEALVQYEESTITATLKTGDDVLAIDTVERI